MCVKHAIFINNRQNLRQEFGWANLAIKSNILKIFNSCIYGSNVYDKHSQSYNQIVNSYSSAVKILLELTVRTHQYMIEAISGRHLDTILLMNSLNFSKSYQLTKNL